MHLSNVFAKLEVSSRAAVASAVSASRVQPSRKRASGS